MDYAWRTVEQVQLRCDQLLRQFDTCIVWRVYTPQNGSCSVVTVNERSRIRERVSKNQTFYRPVFTVPPSSLCQRASIQTRA
jgi:hypothetical protein